MTAPVLFCIFKRPETTRRVFERIRGARPARLYIAADGPRPEKDGEAEACKAARAITEAVDWPCEVSTLLRDRNLGCRNAISGALEWFFSSEEEGIVLEDDVLPDPTFFPFCTELLERYRDDERVGMIAGSNRVGNFDYGDASYLFSRFGGIWGWASWRRVHKDYAVNHPAFSDAKLFERFLECSESHDEAKYWTRCVKKAADGTIPTWDFQWDALLKLNSRLTIVPRVNLIENIGFGPDGTFTFDPCENPLPEPSPIEFPLVHPRLILADRTFSAMNAPVRYKTTERQAYELLVRYFKKKIKTVLGHKLTT